MRWSSLRILSWFNLCCGHFDWLPRFLFIFLFLIIIRKSPYPTNSVYTVTSGVPKNQIGSLNPNYLHSKHWIYSMIIFKHSCFLYLYSLFLYIYLFELSFPFRSVLSNFLTLNFVLIISLIIQDLRLKFLYFLITDLSMDLSYFSPC